MSLALTTAGFDLLMDALAGTAAINFTKVKIGSGPDAGDAASDLSHTEMSIDIQRITLGDVYVRLSAVFNNNSVVTGFRMTEVGVFATDPNDSSAEIMYAYEYIEPAAADFVPPNQDRTLETELNVLAYVGEAENVTATIASGIYAREADFQAHATDEQIHVSANDRNDWTVVVGDIKKSLTAPSSKWLECDGSGIKSADYPDLVPLIQAENPQIIFPFELPDGSVYGEAGATNIDINAQGITYYDGNTFYPPVSSRWAFCAQGTISQSHPVVYSSKRIEGPWVESLLSEENYFRLSGVCYWANQRWWVAFGYSATGNPPTYYPYIFYSHDPTGQWTALKLSESPGMIEAGLWANSKLVLIGRRGSYIYSYVFSTNFLNVSENTITAQLEPVSGIVYHDGTWAVTGSTYIWFTDDLAGSWYHDDLSSKMPENGTITCACYGDGKWVVAGLCGSIGNMSGFLLFTDQIGHNWTLRLLSDPVQSIAYSDGAYVAAYQRSNSDNGFLVLDDTLTLLKKIAINSANFNPRHMAAEDGTFAVTGKTGLSVIRRPQYDAALPDLSSEFGKTYIRALE